MESTSMDFRKVIYENVEKKHLIYKYSQIHFDVLWSFILYTL